MKAAGSFCSGFILPLLNGGEVQVGPPLDSTDLAALTAEAHVASSEVLEIETARQALAAELWLYPIHTPLDLHALQLCLGIHNLLLLSHPNARQPRLSGSSWSRMEAFTSRMLDLAPPKTAEEIIARHTLTHNLLSLSRSDVDLECWVASYSFKGMTPPPRLLRWRRLRRVRERRTEISWPEDAALTELQLTWLTQILRASPLTNLLDPLRTIPPCSWINLAETLQWPGISRLVAHRYLELGVLEVAPALVSSFWELVKTAPSTRWRRAVLFVAGLMFHLYTSAIFFDKHEDEDAREALTPHTPLLPALAACRKCGLVPPVSSLPPTLVEHLNRRLLNVSPPHETAQLQAGLESAVR